MQQQMHRRALFLFSPSPLQRSSLPQPPSLAPLLTSSANLQSPPQTFLRLLLRHSPPSSLSLSHVLFPVDSLSRLNSPLPSPSPSLAPRLPPPSSSAPFPSQRAHPVAPAKSSRSSPSNPPSPVEFVLHLLANAKQLSRSRRVASARPPVALATYAWFPRLLSWNTVVAWYSPQSSSLFALPPSRRTRSGSSLQNYSFRESRDFAVRTTSSTPRC